MYHEAQSGAYRKPALERLGSFRELTRIGAAAGDDISAVFGLGAGCNPDTDDPDFACPDDVRS